MRPIRPTPRLACCSASPAGRRARRAEAARLLDQVARARPGHAHPCHDLAALLRRLGRPDLAAAQYHAALHLAPGDTALRRGLAEHLLEAGDPLAALDVLGDPAGSAAAHHLAGLAWAEAGDIEAATAQFRRTVGLDPGPAAGWSNLGMMLKIAGRHAEALAAHDEAVARAPEDPQLRVNRAATLLHAGRWAEAWGEYEWRLRLPGHAPQPAEPPLPSRASLGDLAGRTVLLTHEGGFGDTMQFARYVPLLAARGAEVRLAVPAALARLLAPLAPVVAPDQPRPRCDFHCPFSSLPRVFATTPDDGPGDRPLPCRRSGAGGGLAGAAGGGRSRAACGPGLGRAGTALAAGLRNPGRAAQRRACGLRPARRHSGRALRQSAGRPARGRGRRPARRGSTSSIRWKRSWISPIPRRSSPGLIW